MAKKAGKKKAAKSAASAKAAAKSGRARADGKKYTDILFEVNSCDANRFLHAIYIEGQGPAEAQRLVVL